MSNSLSPDKLISMSNSELADVSREITGRLNSQDWQRIVQDLRVSGHIHTYHKSAPSFLRHYLQLETDLKDELAGTSMASPLMSSLSLNPQRPRGNEPRMVARLSSQDAGAAVEIGVFPEEDIMTASFSVKNMLTLRFNFAHLDLDERRSFLEMMYRDSGTAFLWTQERWERDYMIFVKQEDFTRAYDQTAFTRVYAFSSHFEASVRLTNEVTGNLLDWLDRCWFPRSKGRRTKRTTTMVDVLSTPELTEKPQVSTFSLQEVANFWDKLSQLDGNGRAALMADAGEDADLLRKIFRSIDQPKEGKARNEATISRDSVTSEMERHLDAMDRIYAKLESIIQDEAPPSEDNKFEW